MDEISLKQQAEPVAWLYKKVEAGLFVSDQQPSDVEVWNDIEWSKPLYTTPPQRKPLTEIELDAEFNRGYKEGARDAYARSPQRKSLTIKEVNAMPEAQGGWPISMNDRIVRLIRAVEAAHGIKE